MLRCLLMKRKLYDYLNHSLSETDNLKVKGHLEFCDNCRERLAQLKTVIDLVAEKTTPHPPEEFWHNFKIDLDRRLNERLVKPLSLKSKARYTLRPAFAYALSLIFILTLGAYLYKKPLSTFLPLGQDEDLIDEIETLDELGEAEEFDYAENAYLDELELFYQLDEI